MLCPVQSRKGTAVTTVVVPIKVELSDEDTARLGHATETFPLMRAKDVVEAVRARVLADVRAGVLGHIVNDITIKEK